MAADKKILAELEVTTGQSRQNIQGVTNELSNQGDAGVKSANAITHALENIENASANVLKKEQDGRVITERDGKVILQQYEVLKNAVDQYAAAGGKVGPELEKSLTTAKAQYDLTTQKVRDATTVLHQQGEELKQGGVAWNGIGDAINKSLGSAGKFQIGILAVGAALKEGWQLGTQFAQAIGTNFSAMESAAGNLKDAFRGITTALTTDGLDAAIQQTAVTLSHLNDTVTGGGKELAGYNLLVQAGVDRAKAATVASSALKEVVEAGAIAQEGGAAALKLFNDTLIKTDPSKLGDAIADITGKLKDLAIQEDINKTKREANKKAVEDSVTALKEEVKQLELLKFAREHHLDVIDAETADRVNLEKAIKAEADAEAHAKDVKNGLTDTMRDELGRLKELTTDYEHHETVINAYVDALKSDYEVHKDNLDPSRKAEIETILKIAEQIKGATGAEKQRLEGQLQLLISTLDLTKGEQAHTEIVKDAQGHYSNLTDAQKKATDAAVALATAYTVNLNPAIDVTCDRARVLETELNKLGSADKNSALGHVSDAANVAAIATKNLSDGLDSFIAKTDAAATHALALAEAIKKMNEAATKAAGNESGAPTAPAAPHPAGTFGNTATPEGAVTGQNK